MFKTHCKLFYDQWLIKQDEVIPGEKKISLSNRWLKTWMREYEVSFRQPNIRFQTKQADREKLIFENLKNNWIVRKFVIDNFEIEPPDINGNHMPLHGTKVRRKKLLNLKEQIITLIITVQKCQWSNWSNRMQLNCKF